MPYNKQTWVDGDRTKPLSAARLNKLETQHEQAMTDVAAGFVTYDGTNLRQNGAVVPITGGSAGFDGGSF